MTVNPDTAIAYDYAGVTHHFCSTDCRDTFTANPDRYLPQPGHRPRSLLTTA